MAVCPSRAAASTTRVWCFELLVVFYASGSGGATRSWLVADACSGTIVPKPPATLPAERLTNWTYHSIYLQFTIRWCKRYQLQYNINFYKTRARASEIPTFHKKSNRRMASTASGQKFPDQKPSVKMHE